MERVRQAMRRGAIMVMAAGAVLDSSPAWSAAPAAVPAAAGFQAAVPVWPDGREKERNLQVGFRAVIGRPATPSVLLRLTGSTVYRIWVNGEFAGYGPARGPHGHFRVDEWEIGPRLRAGRNVVAVEVAGYNVNSYYTLDQPSFLQAEIVSGGRVLAATGPAGENRFEAKILSERVQKVQRYSFQRPFVEAYRLRPGFDAWRRDPEAALEPVALAEAPSGRLLARGIPYPCFRVRQPVRQIREGTLRINRERTEFWADRSLVNIGPALGGYPRQELELAVSDELQRAETASSTESVRPYDPDAPLPLPEHSFRIFDLGRNLTGFPALTVECTTATRLALTYDEILSGDDVNFLRLGSVQGVLWDLEPGTWRLECFEPVTMRFMKVAALSGGATVRGLALREYANDDVWEASFACSDERLNRLFDAGRETFRQNSVDLFMDCPSRERAGWLCDSFFTARAARDLCSSPTIEANFLENYLRPERFEHLPEGMLPMCYPADHNDRVFIPNWALWFVVQLEEYLARTGDRAMVDALEPRVMALFDYFRPFRNEDGLLEKLKGWVFVEWSDANKFLQDVNYPSNMLYAGALDAAGRLYGRPDLREEAERVREVIRRQSFDGEFFVDNAVRRDGRLEVTRNRTEVCQYYAFFFGVAKEDTHAKLWSTLLESFGPKRRESGAFPEIRPANAFIGNVMRTELLSRAGLREQLRQDIIGYYLFMAERTGTLWEFDSPGASCNHGFASHVVHLLYRDMLGLSRIDPAGRVIEVRFPDAGLEWCEGRTATPNGPVSLHWRRDGQEIRYRCSVPAGYELRVEGPEGVRLVAE